MKRSRKFLICGVFLLPLLACAGLAAWLFLLPKQERVIAAYSTSLRQRTKSQAHNLRLAIASLDGTVVQPGAEFSFNQTVGPWTQDRGYRKAPVSYSGERILDWGGGVCQVSTTLYNAALLAGFEIGERHRHHWPASYAPPGQDAAVAFPSIDLRFRNNLKERVRISARVVGESALIEIHSRQAPPKVMVEREVIGMQRPSTVFRYRVEERRPSVSGEAGCEVAVYRRYLDGTQRREFISRDSYPARNRVIWL